MTTTDNILEAITYHINTQPNLTATIRTPATTDHRLEIRISHESPRQDRDAVISIVNDTLIIRLWDRNAHTRKNSVLSYKTIHLSDPTALDQLDGFLNNHWEDT